MLLSDTPVVPHTPSSTINSMLEKRCGKKYSNVVLGALTYYICGFYHVVTTFYNAINPNTTRHSHKLWVTACAVISCLIMLKAYLLYNIIMASVFVMHSLLYYSCTTLALFGVGLGVSGAIFFDKEGEKKGSTPPKRPPVPAKPASIKKFPSDAKVVPGMVHDLETPTKPASPVFPTTPLVPEPTAMSSGTHGSSSEPKSVEEKKLE